MLPTANGRINGGFGINRAGESGGFAEINGSRLFYESAGEGSAVVLVHAGIADRRMWDAQFEAFARTRRVVRYDRRGFGRTEATSAPYASRRDLFELMKHLHIGRATLVGCSQGGKIAVDLALERPGCVAALVLVAPALGGYAHESAPPRQWAELERADAAGDLEAVNELELQVWVDGPRRTPAEVDPSVRALVGEMNLAALRAQQSLGEDEPLEPPAAGRLKEIGVPTLVIVGDCDTERTLEAADFISANVRGARKLVMRGAAHLPNMERPEEFNRAVLNFLNEGL